MKKDGTVWIIGVNDSGELGLGDNSDRNTYTKVTQNAKIFITDLSNFEIYADTTFTALYSALTDGSVAITNDISKTYDGKAVSAPAFTKLGTGTVTIAYKLKDADNSTYTVLPLKI